jgi:hypothetical protein
MNLEDNDFIWGFATYSIMEWQTDHNFFHIPNYQSNQPLKDLFYEAYLEIKNLKNN